MRSKLILLCFLSLFLFQISWGKKLAVDTLSLSIVAYYDNREDNCWVTLSEPGELVLVLDYWELSKNPNYNHYSLSFKGYSHQTKTTKSQIFDSYILGVCQNDVENNYWGNKYYCERVGTQAMEQRDLKHFISFSNGIWETRCTLHKDNVILITCGRLNKDSTLEEENAKSLIISGGEVAWYKLVKFLHQAHKFNIGKKK